MSLLRITGQLWSFFWTYSTGLQNLIVVQTLFVKFQLDDFLILSPPAPYCSRHPPSLGWQSVLRRLPLLRGAFALGSAREIHSQRKVDTNCHCASTAAGGQRSNSYSLSLLGSEVRSE